MNAGHKTTPVSKLTQPKFVLLLIMFVCVLMIGLRVDSVLTTLIEGKTFHPVTPLMAASKAKEEPAEAKVEKKAEGAKEKKAESPKEELPASETRSARPANFDDEETGTDNAIIKQLRERRAQLDQRSQEMDAREAQIKVIEQRVEQKIHELETVRTQIQTLVNTANAAQQAQLENLVKIYETMKPKEAARIFETLEMPTLLGVVERMKPARVAGIMAEMAPEKAKEITMALTKKDQLPQVK